MLDEKVEPFFDEVIRRNPGEVEFLGFEQIFKNALTERRSAEPRAGRTSTPAAGRTTRSCGSARAS